MAGWLAFLFVLGLAKNLQGGMVQVDNAAHVGGAIGGVIIAAAWQRGVTYAERTQRLIVAASVGSCSGGPRGSTCAIAPIRISS